MKTEVYGLISGRKIFHFFADALHSVEVAGLEGAHTGAGDFGNLLVGEIFIVTHQEHRALLFGEGRYSLGEFALGGIAVEPGIGIYHPLRTGVQALELKGGADALLPQIPQRLVGSYAPEPGEVAGIAPEVRECLPGLQEGFLQQVVGIFVAVHKAAYVPVQLFAILAHKFAEYGFRIIQRI